MIENELKDYIVDKYGTLNRFAEKIGMPWTTLNGVMKRGVNNVNITSLIKICEELGIDCESLYYGRIIPKNKSLVENPLSKGEMSMVEKYRALDTYGKSMVDYTLEHEYERCTEIEEPEMPYITTPYYSIGASAGTGQYLFDDLTPSTITIPDTKINRRADLVVDVKGDSMLPKFENGDRVLVQAQDSIDVGQIGIFIVNGEGFIKKLGNGELISLNPTYKNIPLSEDDHVKCVGLVIGKL